MTDTRFAEGCRQFAEGHWFDAHETWESLWHDTPQGDDRLLLQILIQSAVCLHHLSRGNRTGAGRMLSRLIPRLQRLTTGGQTGMSVPRNTTKVDSSGTDIPASPRVTTVDLPLLRRRLETLVAAGDATFAPFAIPLLTQPPPRVGVPTVDPDTQEPPCPEPSP